MDSDIVKHKRTNMREAKVALASRDGKICFACRKPFNFDQLTTEHVLSVMHGGSNHPANIVLVCKPCNDELGAKSISKKMTIIFNKWIKL